MSERNSNTTKIETNNSDSVWPSPFCLKEILIQQRLKQGRMGRRRLVVGGLKEILIQQRLKRNGSN